MSVLDRHFKRKQRTLHLFFYILLKLQFIYIGLFLDTRETKDELNPSPPNEAVNTSPTNPEKSTKPSDSDDDSDITIVRESVPNPGGMMMQGSSPSNLYQSVPHSVSSSVIFPHTRQQQSPNKLLQMQPFSVTNSGQMPPGNELSFFHEPQARSRI